MEKKMNKKVAFLGLSILALALGINTGMQPATIKTEAAKITEGTIIYFKPNALWQQAGAKFYVRINTDDMSEDEYLPLNIGTSTTLYCFTAPSSTQGGFDYIQFLRMDPDNIDFTTGVWNSTSVLNYDGSHPLYVHPNGVWNGAGNQGWSTQDPSLYAINEIPAATSLYFRPTNDFWHKDGQYANRLAAYFFNTDGTNGWVNLTYPQTRTYRALSPTLAGDILPNYVIFASMRSDTSGNSWENVLTQTGDLTPDLTLTRPLYENATLAWKELPTAQNYMNLPEGINANKIRIWVDRNGHYVTSGYKYLLFFNTNNHGYTGIEKAIQLPGGEDVDFLYFDVTTSWIINKQAGIRIINDYDELVVDIPAQTFTAGDNSKIWRVNLVGETWSYEKTVITNKVHNTFVRKVLEGYLTCSNSVNNGYGAFPTMDATFIPKLFNEETGITTWNMIGNLGGQIINDYETIDAYTTGSRTVEVDAYQKYLALETYYNASGLGGIPFLPMLTKTNSWLVTGLMLIMLGLSLFSYQALRKKRTQN